MIFKPELSIIIVNVNGWQFLEPLLKSIENNKIKDHEVVIVDNNSTNDEMEKIENFCKLNNKIKLIKLPQNYGPAMARNIGVKNSSGEFISFLDNDTLVDKNWAAKSLEYFKKFPRVGIIQCKLLLQSDHTKLDYVGEFLGSNGFLVQECSAGEVDKGQFAKPKKILAAKSAGMFIRRKTFNIAGGFDDDYFIYVEETDLGWRSWLAGFEVHFLPSSVVYHHYGTSSVILGLDKASALAKFHGPKNYISTLIKNLSIQKIFLVLPIHIFLWLGLAFFRLFSFKIKDFLYIISGVTWPFVHLPKIIKKRNHVTQMRKRNDEFIFKNLVVSRSLIYFVNKAIKHTTIGNAKSY